VDVGGFAEPRKILCQCALPSYEQLSVQPRSAHRGVGIPQQIAASKSHHQQQSHVLAADLHNTSKLTHQQAKNLRAAVREKHK
jgi:hypothetical protein